MAERISFIPDITADMLINSALTLMATSLAMVVLPVPGGPQKIIDGSNPLLRALPIILSVPITAFCPTTSSIFDGRRTS